MKVLARRVEIQAYRRDSGSRYVENHVHNRVQAKGVQYGSGNIGEETEGPIISTPRLSTNKYQ